MTQEWKSFDVSLFIRGTSISRLTPKVELECQNKELSCVNVIAEKIVLLIWMRSKTLDEFISSLFYLENNATCLRSEVQNLSTYIHDFFSMEEDISIIDHKQMVISLVLMIGLNVSIQDRTKMLSCVEKYISCHKSIEYDSNMVLDYLLMAFGTDIGIYSTDTAISRIKQYYDVIRALKDNGTNIYELFIQRLDSNIGTIGLLLDKCYSSGLDMSIFIPSTVQAKIIMDRIISIEEQYKDIILKSSLMFVTVFAKSFNQELLQVIKPHIDKFTEKMYRYTISHSPGYDDQCLRVLSYICGMKEFSNKGRKYGKHILDWIDKYRNTDESVESLNTYFTQVFELIYNWGLAAEHPEEFIDNIFSLVYKFTHLDENVLFPVIGNKRKTESVASTSKRRKKDEDSHIEENKVVIQDRRKAIQNGCTFLLSNLKNPQYVKKSIMRSLQDANLQYISILFQMRHSLLASLSVDEIEDLYIHLIGKGDKAIDACYIDSLSTVHDNDQLVGVESKICIKILSVSSDPVFMQKIISTLADIWTTSSIQSHFDSWTKTTHDLIRDILSRICIVGKICVYMCINMLLHTSQEYTDDTSLTLLLCLYFKCIEATQRTLFDISKGSDIIEHYGYRISGHFSEFYKLTLLHPINQYQNTCAIIRAISSITGDNIGSYIDTRYMVRNKSILKNNITDDSFRILLYHIPLLRNPQHKADISSVIREHLGYIVYNASYKNNVYATQCLVDIERIDADVISRKRDKVVETLWERYKNNQRSISFFALNVILGRNPQLLSLITDIPLWLNTCYNKCKAVICSEYAIPYETFGILRALTLTKDNLLPIREITLSITEQSNCPINYICDAGFILNNMKAILGKVDWLSLLRTETGPRIMKIIKLLSPFLFAKKRSKGDITIITFKNKRY